MSAIKILLPEIQNQIAAGEVVERPASIVKELVENSIDAKANWIRVILEDGGKRLIQIADDGIGIPKDELALALTRYATSKLEKFDDLAQLTSFGFRGEALPSIASVSRFKLISKAAQTNTAYSVEVEQGKISKPEPSALQKGTIAEIRELFAITPARLKFLKTTETEAKRAIAIFVRLSLAHLNIEFEFIHGGHTIYHFYKNQTLQERLAQVWPPSLMQNLFEINYESHGMKISGFVGSSQSAQNTADRIYLYLNQRPIQNKIIMAAIRQAYKGKLLSKEYPQAILFLNIAPHEVDVNAHPAKTEVRFHDEQGVFSLVSSAIVRALGNSNSSQNCELETEKQITPKLAVNYNSANQLNLETDFMLKEPRSLYGNNEKFSNIKQNEQLFNKNKDYSFEKQNIHSDSKEFANQKNIIVDKISPKLQTANINFEQSENAEFKYLGQLDNTYLIIKKANGNLILIDQHAAHERVLMYKFEKNAFEGEHLCLAIPLEINLHHDESARLAIIWNELKHLGFTLEQKNETVLLLKAMPSTLTTAQAKKYLRAALCDQSKTIESLWTMMSCRLAIKAGQALTVDEAIALIELWSQLPDCKFCPHGRPIALEWTLTEIEKMFKRKG